jgi:peptidoglycan/xylan/chitin deacetylase (PgdA/CDA1 family)
VSRLSRRELLAQLAAAPLAARAVSAAGEDPLRGRALIAITLDLEMSRNFPVWEDTHWDYEKGNLNDETKRYTVEACRRVKAVGGRVHCFVVGRVLEQEHVEWLQQLAAEGHRLGNHTYDHVNILATKPEDVQFRFRRAPWLLEGKSAQQAIADNIRLTSRAMKTRLGLEPAGFRTPGGFATGLAERPDVQKLLLDQGFRWVSSKYPVGEMGKAPNREVLTGIVKAQEAAQPFVYPSGLVEVPMSPISDVNAFRNARWKLDDFLTALRAAVEWTIEHRAVFDFLSHPSCLYVMDPQFQAIELICELVRQAGDRAALVDLDTLARRPPR